MEKYYIYDLVKIKNTLEKTNPNKLTIKQKQTIMLNVLSLDNIYKIKTPTHLTVYDKIVVFNSEKGNQIKLSKTNMLIEINDTIKFLKNKAKQVDRVGVKETNNEILSKIKVIENIVVKNKIDTSLIIKYFKPLIKYKQDLYRGYALSLDDFEKINEGDYISKHYSFTLDKEVAFEFSNSSSLDIMNGIEILISVSEMRAVSVLSMINDVRDTVEFKNNQFKDKIIDYGESESEYICMEKELYIEEIVEFDDDVYIFNC